MSSKFIFNSLVGNVAETVHGDQKATLHIDEQQTNLVEVTEEIQKVLDYLEHNKPTVINAQGVVAQAVESHPILKNRQAIEKVMQSNPTLKIRLQRAVTAAGIETVKVLFAPAGIMIEAIKAWINPT